MYYGQDKMVLKLGTPQNRSQSTIALHIGTPQNGTPKFGKLPVRNSQGAGALAQLADRFGEKLVEVDVADLSLGCMV